MRLLDIATYFTPREGSAPTVGAELDDDAVLRAYAYPEALTRPWIRVNFVSSIDGAVTADGASAGLGTPADKRVFDVLRGAADAVVVGAGTARSENYGGVRLPEWARARRVALGQQPVPPVVVVTGSASLDPRSRLFTDTDVPPTIITTTSAPADARRRLQNAGASVFALKTDAVFASGVSEILDSAGHRRILLEGGPGLFGTFLDDDAVDEVCLTTSPVVVGGSAGRISRSSTASLHAMKRAHVIADDDGTVLTRWVRTRSRDVAESSRSEK
ncbi:pyrimidine reductase family protein [Rhodococcoides yunnanense]|uniref:pyrimidine reductase family protein n=1 Tax=Rhodococcoides yunnanense TaxID=278209 RepID=UPI000934442C|nr:pyrimidine reductase family protein [Rhodococcus yunnanensis]